MNGLPADTTVEMAKKEYDILRGLEPEGRAKMAFEMSDGLRRIVEDGVRHRHPDWDETQIKLDVLRLMIGNKLYRQIIKSMRTSS